MKRTFTLIFFATALLIGQALSAAPKVKVSQQNPSAIGVTAFSQVKVYSYGKHIVLKGATNMQLVVFNPLGQKVYTNTVQNGEMDITLNNLERGMYVVQLRSGKDVMTRKVMME